MSNKMNYPSRRRGTAIVEMAFVVVIMLMLMMGLIQWGMILNASISITNLSREGARYAAVHYKADNDEIRNYIRNNAPPGINAGDLTISLTPDDPNVRTARDAIRVTIEYDMRKKLFLPARAFGINFFNGTYRAEGQMMMEG